MDVELGSSSAFSQNALLVQLTTYANSKAITIAATHLKADDSSNNETIRLEQSTKLLQKLDSFLGIKKTPVILCGDMNSTPDESVYQLFSNSVLNNAKVGDPKNDTTTTTTLQNPFKLKSAYGEYREEGEPHHTIFSPNFERVLDYIWYTDESLELYSLLEIPSDKHIPNQYFPSDHFSMMCQFTSYLILINTSTLRSFSIIC